MRILENVMLSNHTTIGIGGIASHLSRPSTEEEIIECLKWAQARNLPVLILGGGSNLLISDNGFRGLVIQVNLKGIAWETNGRVSVEAGESWDSFVLASLTRGMSGIECLSGIPGTVGATPIQNVGAYGQEISQTLVRVDGIDQKTLEPISFSKDQCNFSYRTSRFKSKNSDSVIITRVHFQLNTRNVSEPIYPELARKIREAPQWSGSDNTQKLNLIRNEVLSLRRSKGMVIDPADPDSKSLGSFFTNPIVTIAERDQVKVRCVQMGILDPLPEYPGHDGHIKLSAAWLIEKSGISKGQTHKGAGISTKHTLALVNRDHASAADILELAAKIQQQVYQKFGVTLDQEPILIGTDSDSYSTKTKKEL